VSTWTNEVHRQANQLSQRLLRRLDSHTERYSVPSLLVARVALEESLSQSAYECARVSTSKYFSSENAKELILTLSNKPPQENLTYRQLKRKAVGMLADAVETQAKEALMRAAILKYGYKENNKS
jgi:hypothetical protein